MHEITPTPIGRRGGAMRRCRRARARARGGFTLIELLIVIAIIAVLIAILLPALSVVRETARAAACLSNQRQIGMAFNFYADANTEYFPRDASDANPNLNDDRGDCPPWAFALRPHIDSRALDDDVNGGFEDNRGNGDLYERAEYFHDPGRPEDAHQIHYVVNSLRFIRKNLVRQIRTGVGKGPTRRDSLPTPAGTLYLSGFRHDPRGIQSDQWYARNSTNWSVAIFYDLWAATNVNAGDQDLGSGFSRRIEPAMHGDGANGLYLDGHAEPVRGNVLTDVNAWDDKDYSGTTNLFDSPCVP